MDVNDLGFDDSFLDVHGPGMTLITACSGGLVALDNGGLFFGLGFGELC